MTPTTRGRRRPAAAALALPLLALVLLLSSGPTGARARGGGRRKHNKSYCASIERNCGFGGGGSDWERNSANFVLKTLAGGDPICTVVPPDAGAECRYDADTATLRMRVDCFGGASHGVVQQACGPIGPNDDDIEVVDPWALPAPNQNQFLNAGFCAAEVEPPAPGEAVEWFVQVFCTEFEEIARSGGRADRRAAAPGRPAVASFEQSARAGQARAAAKAAAAAAAVAAVAEAAPAAAAGK
jgi:hypothetical protein